jgi:glycosyltransferase involved in cell wall biosynthesis
MMRKKVALVFHSIDILFPPDGGVKGGANRVNLVLLQALIANPDIELTLISLAGGVKSVAGVDHHFFFEKSIYTHKAVVMGQIAAFLAENPQDSILFSDVIAPFGSTLFHSHSFAHRQAIKPWWVKPFTVGATIKRHRVQLKDIGDVSNRKFFTVSKAVKADWSHHFGMDANLVHVAYPGVEVSDETPKTDGQNQSDFPVFGMVNTSSLKKGGLLFIMALGLLKISGHRFSVKMIHPKIVKDPLTSVLITLLGLKSTIAVLPFQPDTSAFYKSIDAFVMPSLHEAFGLVVTEAMSHGVIPIVASNAGAAELIEPEVTGFSFDIKHFPAWQLFKVLKQVLRLNEDRRMQLKLAAIDIAKQYSWKRFAETIIEQL